TPASASGASVCDMLQSGSSQPAAMATAVEAAITTAMSTSPRSDDVIIFFHCLWAKDSRLSPTDGSQFSRVTQRHMITDEISGVNIHRLMGTMASGLAKPMVVKTTASMIKAKPYEMRTKMPTAFQSTVFRVRGSDAVMSVAFLLVLVRRGQTTGQPWCHRRYSLSVLRGRLPRMRDAVQPR